MSKAPSRNLRGQLARNGSAHFIHFASFPTCDGHGRHQAFVLAASPAMRCSATIAPRCITASSMVLHGAWPLGASLVLCTSLQLDTVFYSHLHSCSLVTSLPLMIPRLSHLDSSHLIFHLGSRTFLAWSQSRGTRIGISWILLSHCFQHFLSVVLSCSIFSIPSPIAHARLRVRP